MCILKIWYQTILTIICKRRWWDKYDIAMPLNLSSYFYHGGEKKINIKGGKK
jgi:hypothetical protein